MRIEEIDVKNFRGIRELCLKGLKSTVVIAGANGSGKSCVFDAIRLLKSAYGGYQQNEWHHWMAEFQINFTNNAEAF
ncbi:AAA family ATPase [Sphingobium sp. 15-1]|nr:AAA family ATPase [Sphingobium sp. 15-1]